MRKHRHHPKISWRLMYDTMRFFTTGTELQCYKCKATILPSRAGWFMMLGFEALCSICIAIILIFAHQLDMVKQLSRNRIAYSFFWLGIILTFGLLLNIISVLFARFFIPFREKEN